MNYESIKQYIVKNSVTGVEKENSITQFQNDLYANLDIHANLESNNDLQKFKK
jgi:hypothetical protein